MILVTGDTGELAGTVFLFGMTLHTLFVFVKREMFAIEGKPGVFVVIKGFGPSAAFQMATRALLGSIPALMGFFVLVTSRASSFPVVCKTFEAIRTAAPVASPAIFVSVSSQKIEARMDLVIERDVARTAQIVAVFTAVFHKTFFVLVSVAVDAFSSRLRSPFGFVALRAGQPPMFGSKCEACGVMIELVLFPLATGMMTFRTGF